MGSQGVVQTIRGSSAKAAYDAAYDLARWESGSGGYTGTMAESSGMFVVNGTYLPWEADHKGHQMLNTDAVTKWGPTALIPVVDPVSPRTIELTVDITGTGDWDARNTAIKAAVESKLRAGERIAVLNMAEGEKKTKVVTTVTQGPTKTVYRVRGQQYVKMFPTLAEAKAGAKSVLDAPNGWETDLTITKVTIRENDEPLVRVKKVVTKETMKIVAVVGKLSTAVPKQWVAVGWYSS